MYWLIVGACGGVFGSLAPSRARAAGVALKWRHWLLLTVWYVWTALGVSFVLDSIRYLESKAAGVGALVFLVPAILLGAVLFRRLFVARRGGVAAQS